MPCSLSSGKLAGDTVVEVGLMSFLGLSVLFAVVAALGEEACVGDAATVELGGGGLAGVIGGATARGTADWGVPMAGIDAAGISGVGLTAGWGVETEVLGAEA